MVPNRLMSEQLTRFPGTLHRLHGELKSRRCLYLTATAHDFLVDLANRYDISPSEVCERLIRNEKAALANKPRPFVFFS